MVKLPEELKEINCQGRGLSYLKHDLGDYRQNCSKAPLKARVSSQFLGVAAKFILTPGFSPLKIC